MSAANKTARLTEANGFRKMFAPGRLSLGVFFPIEACDKPTILDYVRARMIASQCFVIALAGP